MRKSEIIRRLKQSQFSAEQARILADILEEQQETILSKKYPDTLPQKYKEPITIPVVKAKDHKRDRFSQFHHHTNNTVMPTNDHLNLAIEQFKIDLRIWIAGGVVVNGLFLVFLKYLC